VTVREIVFDQQAATIVDGITTPPARFDVAGARLVMRDFKWPARGTIPIELTTPTPVAGRLGVTGTVTLEPVRIDVRAALDGVSVEPAQPYLPIEGGTFTIERADARFVDYVTTPPYAEDVSDMQLIVTGFTTAPGGRTRFTGSGGLGGGSFTLKGESMESRGALDMKLDLKDVV